MQKNNDFENVINDIIEYTEILSQDVESQSIELQSEEGNNIELELMFSFKINDSMYALCVNEDDELVVLRRDQIHRTTNFVLVDTEIELSEVRNALQDLIE